MQQDKSLDNARRQDKTLGSDRGEESYEPATDEATRPLIDSKVVVCVGVETTASNKTMPLHMRDAVDHLPCSLVSCRLIIVGMMRRRQMLVRRSVDGAMIMLTGHE